MDAPTSAYEKTQPFEACMFFFYGIRDHCRISLTVSPSFAASTDAGKLKARFESMAKASDEENRRKAEEEKARRRARESRERELAERRQEVRTHNTTTSESARGGCLCLQFPFLFLQEERSREEENPPDVPDEAPQSDNPPPVVSENRQKVEERPESEVKNRFKDIR